MNIQSYLTKNWLFSVALALVTVLIIYRIIPVTVDHVVKLTITKNRTSISNIYQQRDVESTNEVWVDVLNLEHKSRFGHPKLGNVANYSEDFFVDVDHNITVKDADNYRFLIGSDDGFSLKVDGKLLCEHLGDRPFSVQPCLVHLNAGQHRVQVSYFQGYGNSGFTVEYARGDEKSRWFGDDSNSVKF